MELPFKEDLSQNSFVDEEKSCKVVNTYQDKGEKHKNLRKIVPKMTDYAQLMTLSAYSDVQDLQELEIQTKIKVLLIVSNEEMIAKLNEMFTNLAPGCHELVMNTMQAHESIQQRLKQGLPIYSLVIAQDNIHFVDGYEVLREIRSKLSKSNLNC